MYIYRLDEQSELQLLDPRHGEELYELINRNRDYLSEWLSWVQQANTKEDVMLHIHILLMEFQNQRAFPAVILHEGQIAGEISLHSMDWINQKAELGYWIGEEYQGFGLVTKSVKKFMQYTFETIGFNRLEIKAGAKNKRSRAIPERLFFLHEGTIRDGEWLSGHYHDISLYSFLKREWNSLKDK